MGDTYTRQSSYTDGDVITAAHTNNEFNQLLAAFAASTGHTHDGTAAEGGPITKLLGNALTFGAGTAGTDITITFDGETSDGELKWMEDEDYFEFSDDILIASTEKLQFRDTAIYINSSTDGQLDLVADTEIQIAATTIDMNGNVDISGTLTIGSAGISEAELEILDGATVTTTELNILDGDTSATSTTVADADRVVFNDAGTMKQVAVTDLAAYFDDEITAMPNLVTTAATTVGALNSGSITSGFGTIDTGSSTITTTGLITGGSLDIDDVVINGSTIGHTDDTDLITVANGIATVAGEISVTTLDIGGTNVTSTAAELNILDGVTATAAELNYSDTGAAVGTVVASKVVTVDSNKDVASFRNITLTGELDAGSLDVSGDADIDGTLEADAITVNGTALNTVIAGVTVTDATNSAHVLVTDNESTNEENLITFVEDATSSTGNVGLEMDGNLTYNPSTGTLTSTVFKGNIDAVDGDFDGTLEADAITLDGTAITATATLDTGISNNNVPKFTSGVADNDFLRVDGTAIEGRSASEVLSDIAAAPAAGSSNIVTTGALNSGSITSGFGAINNGSSAITTTGTMTFGSLSDGSITVTAFVDEDNMASDSATLVPTQQSVKAFVEANAGAPAAGSSNLVTTGALNSGSITSGFGSIDNGSSAITTTGVITGGTLEATADTSAGDNAAIGFTSAEGLILTGQGSTSDITLKNDADATVAFVPTGTDDLRFPDDAQIQMGDSGDLVMYHNGSNSFIEDNGTGNFLITTNGNNITLMKNQAETMAVFKTDGACELYNDNVLKLTTAAGGVDITGAFTATDGSTITTADNTTQLTLTSTDADATAGPRLDLKRDSGSPADNDTIGRIRFLFDNDAAEQIEGVRIDGHITDASDGTEDTSFNISTVKAGTLQQSVKFGASETVFNESSLDIDFRVESDNTTHALFVEGSSGNVGIGDDNPGRMLHIKALGTGTAEQAALLMENEVGTTGEIRQGPASDNAMIFTENGSERMRVNTSGALLIGKTSDSIGNDGISAAGSATGGGHLSATNSGNPAFAVNRKSSDGSCVSFNRDGSVVGSVSVTSSGTTFNTTSDIRLKQDIEPLQSTDKLMAMNPVSYAWKADPNGPRSMGFIAQEMKEIVPDAVSADDSEEKMLRMDYGRITPILVSALQDAHRKIEQLEQRIAEMEAK